MNRLVFAVSAACVAASSSLAGSSLVFAQSEPPVQSDVIQHPATNYSSTSAAKSDKTSGHESPAGRARAR